MKKIFITGAGGFIGGWLAEWISRSCESCLLSGSYYNPTVGIGPCIDAGCSLTEIDVRDYTALRDVMIAKRPDIIFHLAAQSYPVPSWVNPEYTYQTNIIGTDNLMRALSETGLRSRVIVAGSMASYGYIDPSEAPVSESQPMRPAHPYGVSKAAQEMVGLMHHRARGCDVVVARIGNAVGPRRKGEVVSDFTMRGARIETGLDRQVFRVGNLHPKRAFMDVRDLVRALWLLAENGASGDVYNICGDFPVSIAELLEQVKSLLSVNAEIAQDPSLVRNSDEPIYWGSHQKLSDLTGWQPKITLRKTIEDMFAWWMKELEAHEHE